MTTDSIKELVKRLREVIVEDRGHGHTTEWTRNLDGHEAADALEAMAGEVASLKTRYDAYVELTREALEQAALDKAERDRLKELYDAGCKQWNPVFKVVLDERNRLKAALDEAVKWMDGCAVSGGYPAWHAKARKALGGDA